MKPHHLRAIVGKQPERLPFLFPFSLGSVKLGWVTNLLSMNFCCWWRGNHGMDPNQTGLIAPRAIQKERPGEAPVVKHVFNGLP
jgi:hypothetical protein